MGARYKIPAPPKYWWHEGDYGFTWEELLLIRRFIILKTYDDLAKQQQCSARTIQRQLAPIFTKIGAKDRQRALDILQNINAPDSLSKRS